MIKNLFVLGGGLSSRFNKDKLFLKYKNKYLIEIIFDEIGNIFDNHYLVIDKNKYIPKSKYTVINDIYDIKTPLNGVITSLEISNSDKNFICACDMPFIKKEVVEYLLSFDGYDVVIPYDGMFFEPLCCVYSKRFLDIAKKCIRKGILSLNKCIMLSNNVKTIQYDELKVFDSKLQSFFNINTYENIKEYDGFEF